MNGFLKALLPNLTILHPSEAQSYLVAARYFYAGVEALVGSSVETARACAFLGSQTLESLLKSYLSHAGVGEGRLKNNFGHNLESLWIETVKYHLNIQSQPPQWCVILNSLHNKPYYLRYPMGINGMKLPELIQMACNLKDILAVVEQAVGG